MKNPPQASRNSATIVFKLWKSLNYKTRLGISFLCIFIGLFIQYFSLSFFPGILLAISGNLLLLPQGHDTRINLGKYFPSAEWEMVTQNKLTEFVEFERKTKKWDKSGIDVSNPAGAFIFILIILVLAIVGINAYAGEDKVWQMIFVNAVVLIIPYWLTGLKRISLIPHMTIKISFILKLIDMLHLSSDRYQVNYYFCLHGDEHKIPRDVKCRIMVKAQPVEFLGLYGQIVINMVQNYPYPYFYAVLVAKPNYGLKKLLANENRSTPFIFEYKVQQDVEILVIRQDTVAVKNGYHSKSDQALIILRTAISLTEQITRQNPDVNC